MALCLAGAWQTQTRQGPASATPSGSAGAASSLPSPRPPRSPVLLAASLLCPSPLLLLLAWRCADPRRRPHTRRPADPAPGSTGSAASQTAGTLGTLLAGGSLHAALSWTPHAAPTHARRCSSTANGSRLRTRRRRPGTAAQAPHSAGRCTRVDPATRLGSLASAQPRILLPRKAHLCSTCTSIIHRPPTRLTPPRC
jgi:hypothetical protein